MVREDVDETVQKTIEIEEEEKVSSVLEKEDIPIEEVIVAVDDTIVSKNRKLKGGETVRVMQVVAGG